MVCFSRQQNKLQPAQTRSQLHNEHFDLLGNHVKHFNFVGRGHHFIAGGFISNGTELIKGYLGGVIPKVRMDWENLRDVYNEFCTAYSRFMENPVIMVGPEKPLPPNIEAAIKAAWKATWFYLGPPNNETIKKHFVKINKKPVCNISDFKAESSAVCLEYALLVHQLLSVSGIESRMTGGGVKNDYKKGEDEPINDPDEDHSFLILRINRVNGDEIRYLLLDPINLQFTKGLTDDKTYYSPLVAEIDPQVYIDSVKQGRPISVKTPTLDFDYFQ